MEVTIHYNGQAVAVEVTLEVYEFLDRADHKAENLSHEQRRHWDGREFDEYIVATEGVGIYGETPEEYLCRMETLGELMAVLDTCTEAQRRRFLLYALDGLTLAEIGTVCGCSKVSVYCPECAPKVHRRQKAECERRRRVQRGQLEDKNPL